MALEAFEAEAGAAPEIIEGILRCPNCRRWHAVREGIPDLVSDGLRDAPAERAFLDRHRARVGDDLLRGGIPVSLDRADIRPTEAEARVLEEGRYWGEFMEAFWSVGDRSIFDVRVRGTHPSFYGVGVLECDERDRRRRCGLWPDHLSPVVFGWMDEWMDGTGDQWMTVFV